MYASRVDAVIVASTLFTTDFSHFDILRQNNIPVIFDRVPVKPYPACIVKEMISGDLPGHNAFNRVGLQGSLIYQVL
jgi:hypothetical protein